MSHIYLFLSVVIVFLFPFSVRADVFVVDNERAKFSASFPDDWKIVNNQKPNDVLTIMAPGQVDEAQCRVRVQSDQRFGLYPVSFSAAVRDEVLSQKFWESYLTEYFDSTLVNVKPHVGFGRGFGSMAEVRFTTAVGTELDKHGLIFASLYGNRLYVAECAARMEYFSKWRRAFMGVVKSIDFDKVAHELPRGNYREFSDSALKIYGPHNIDAGRY